MPQWRSEDNSGQAVPSFHFYVALRDRTQAIRLSYQVTLAEMSHLTGLTRF